MALQYQRELKQLFAGEVSGMVKAHNAHQGLQDLTLKVAPLMTSQLVKPYGDFVSCYKDYYEECVGSLIELHQLAEEVIPQLVSAKSDRDQFLDIVSVYKEDFESLSTLDRQYRGLTEASKQLYNALSLQTAHLNANPELEMEQEKLENCQQKLRAAEINLQQQRVLAQISSDIARDRALAVDSIHKRLREIDASLQSHNEAYDQAVRDDQHSTHRSRFLWFVSSYEVKNDTSRKRALIQERTNALQAEKERLTSILQSGNENQREVLLGLIQAPEAAASAVESARRELENQEKVMVEKRKIHLESTIAKAQIAGLKDPTSLAELITSILQITGHLNVIRSYIVSTRKALLRIGSGSREPQNRLYSARALVKAPIYRAALEHGNDSCEMYNSLTYLAMAEDVINARNELPDVRAKVEVLEDAVQEGTVE